MFKGAFFAMVAVEPIGNVNVIQAEVTGHCGPPIGLQAFINKTLSVEFSHELAETRHENA